MGKGERRAETMRMQKRRILSLFLAVLMLRLAAYPAMAAESVDSAKAAAIQLMKTTGTVNVTNSNLRSVTTRDNMRLYNGYHVETRAASYAWINLDSTKLAKLDAVSEAEVRKSGKVLELMLNSGNLYFNVTSPLKEDETMNIRTSTMVVGIRGTCGWLRVVDRWSTEIYVLEGTVQCSVADPVTGQVKTAEIRSGEMAAATVYPQDQAGDKCGITQKRIEPGDIDGFVLEELAQDPGLCGDIYEASGLDVLAPMGLLESVRRQLESIRKEMDGIRKQLAEGSLSVEDAQVRLGEFRKQMEDVKEKLEQAGSGGDVRQRLDEAQEHLDQAWEALDTALNSQEQGEDIHQDVLDSLANAQEALDSAHQQQAADAQQKGAESAQGRLEQDQKDMQDKLGHIEDQLTEQDNNGSTEHVWGQEAPKPNPAKPGSSTNTGGSTNTGSDIGNTGGSGTEGTGGGVTDEPANPVQRVITVTIPGVAPDDPVALPAFIRELQGYLNDNRIQEVVLETYPQADRNALYVGYDTLSVCIDLTIPEGKTLRINDAGAVIQDSASLTINGAMTGTLPLTNHGTLTVNSSHTLHVPSIENYGSLTNTETGQIVTKELRTSNVLTNAGRIEGHVIVNGGTFTMDGGEVISYNSAAGCTVVCSAGGHLYLNGGTITSSGDGCALSAAEQDVTFGNTDIRAKRQELFSGGWMPEGYVSVYEEDEYYHLRPESGNDLLERLRNAENGKVITLTRDMTAEFDPAADPYVISGGSEADPVVLDLNGYTLDIGMMDIYVYGALNIRDSKDTGSGILKLGGCIRVGRDDAPAYLYLDSGTIDSEGADAIVLYGDSTFTNSGGTYNGGINSGGTNDGGESGDPPSP